MSFFKRVKASRPQLDVTPLPNERHFDLLLDIKSVECNEVLITRKKMASHRKEIKFLVKGGYIESLNYHIPLISGRNQGGNTVEEETSGDAYKITELGLEVLDLIKKRNPVALEQRSQHTK